MLRSNIVRCALMMALIVVLSMPAAAQSGITITVGLNSIARSLDPIKTISWDSASLVANMYDTLVVFDPADITRVLPSLATSWEVSDDASVWTFYLRKGVKFTTGNELTAEDVKFSIQRGMAANYPVYPPIAQFLDPETGIEVLDDYTIRFVLTRPYSGFGLLLASTKFGVVDSKALKPHMTEDDPFGSNYLDDHSLGSGPLKLKRWQRGERIVLERNPDYWGIPLGHRVPAFDELVHLHVPEPVTQRLMLQRGDIQVAMDLTVEMALEMMNDSRVRIERVPVFIGTAILMNPNHPPFSDPNVRNAVRWAIDYDSIINELMRGYGIRMDRPIFKPLAGSSDTVLYSYDLQRAREYLAQSAYPTGFSFSLAIGTGAGMGVPWDLLAVKEQVDLSQLGINVRIEQYDWSVMDEKLFSGNYEALQVWFGSVWPEAESAMAMNGRTVDSIHLRANPWTNIAIDELADQARVEVDPAKRAALYEEISRLHAEDGVFAFIAQQEKPIGFGANVVGFDGNPVISNFDWSSLRYVD